MSYQFLDSKSSGNQDSKNARLLRIFYEDRKALTIVPDTLEDVFDVARTMFRIKATDDLIAETNMPRESEIFEIDHQVWGKLKLSVTRVWIRKETHQPPSPASTGPVAKKQSKPDLYTTPRYKSGIRISLIVSFRGDELHYTVSPLMKISKLKDSVLSKLGIDDLKSPHHVRFSRDSDYKELKPYKTVGDYFDEDNYPNNITVSVETKGGKPVIYLFSPTPIDARVTLKLVPEWQFSALYPVTKVEDEEESDQRCLQVVSWDVSVSPNGTLFDKASESEVTYLYWEATTTPDKFARVTPPNTCPSSPTCLAFNPAEPDIKPSNSVLVSLDKLPKYLDVVLLALGLHTEARTSFITYWLPSLNIYPNTALRFLPQSFYEKAASLNIEPAPAAVLRVFMLWKGIGDDEMEYWKDARIRFEEMQADEWRDIVGVPVSFKMPTATNVDEPQSVEKDYGLTVLEWGGMEVQV